MPIPKFQVVVFNSARNTFKSLYSAAKEEDAVKFQENIHALLLEGSYSAVWPIPRKEGAFTAEVLNEMHVELTEAPIKTSEAPMQPDNKPKQTISHASDAEAERIIAQAQSGGGVKKPKKTGIQNIDGETIAVDINNLDPKEYEKEMKAGKARML